LRELANKARRGGNRTHYRPALNRQLCQIELRAGPLYGVAAPSCNLTSAGGYLTCFNGIIPFYYTEESQQNQFTCAECGEFHDILGKFGYCSACGTRNDLQELEGKIIPSIRNRTNASGPYEACLKDIASAFDSFVAQYVKQLTQNLPLRPSRKAKIERMRFLNLDSVRAELKSVFDIDICDGLKDTEVAFASRMFHRRHVYEHNGGEADEKYIADSGDKSVRLKQALRESQQSVHQFTNLVAKMACNLHRGFHEIFPAEQERINLYAKTKSRMKARGILTPAAALRVRLSGAFF
jgi:hypothetical protein